MTLDLRFAQPTQRMGGGSVGAAGEAADLLGDQGTPAGMPLCGGIE